MLNEEIEHNRFESVLVVIVIDLFSFRQLFSIRLQYKCFNNILFSYLFREVV